jgi:hypothetical protein
MRKHFIGYNEEDNGYITLVDGTTIDFCHEQDCCETVYADLSALNDTGFETDMSICWETLKIEVVKDYGFRLNGYGIPCYNSQNGYYSSNILVTISKNFYVEEDMGIADYD